MLIYVRMWQILQILVGKVAALLNLHEIFDVKREELTPTQKRVLEFILKYPEEAVFLTASRLALRLNISDTSIVRMAQALGFDGYPDLRRKLRRVVQDRLSTVDRLDATAGEVETVEDVFANVLLRDVANLRSVLRDIDPAVFAGAADSLDNAGRVFVIGLRSANCLAVFLVSALRFLSREVVHLSPGTGEMWEQIRDMGPDDVVVCFSFPRYTKVTVDVVQYASEMGAEVVAVTDSDLSPLAASARWTLTVPFEVDSFMESFTAGLSLINALVTAIAFKNRSMTIETLKEMEGSWASRGVYWDG